jgi:hypothetical protein
MQHPQYVARGLRVMPPLLRLTPPKSRNAGPDSEWPAGPFPSPSLQACARLERAWLAVPSTTGLLV